MSQFIMPADAQALGDNQYQLSDGSIIDVDGNILVPAPGSTDTGNSTTPCGCHKRARYNMMHGMVNNHLLSLVFLVLIIMGAVWIIKKI